MTTSIAEGLKEDDRPLRAEDLENLRTSFRGELIQSGHDEGVVSRYSLRK